VKQSTLPFGVGSVVEKVWWIFQLFDAGDEMHLLLNPITPSLQKIYYQPNRVAGKLQDGRRPDASFQFSRRGAGRSGLPSTAA